MTQVPTVDREAEQAVLGGCLLSGDAIDDCAAVVSPTDFFDPLHEAAFQAMVALRSEGKPVDVITLAEQLGDMLVRRGGLPIVHGWVQAVPVAANAGYYARTVRDAALHRAVVSTGHQLAALPRSEEMLDVVNSARAMLDTLVTGDSPTTHSDDLYAAMDVLEVSDPFLPTPWKDLTRAIGGWRPGCLYYIGARPAVGKSVLGVNAFLDVARRGKHAHLATLEMSRVEVYHRLLSTVASVDQERMQRRFLDSRDWGVLAKAASHIADLPMSVDDRSDQRVVDIRARCRAIARTQPLGLVVVDYLQLMQSTGRTENRQQEVAEFSRQLKLLARELDVPVIALSQLNRGSEARSDRMPGMSDLRESGALEQDGDVVCLLHRDMEKPDELLVLVAKNRHGPGDLVVRLQWEGAYARATDRLATPRIAPHLPDGSYYDQREDPA